MSVACRATTRIVTRVRAPSGPDVATGRIKQAHPLTIVN